MAKKRTKRRTDELAQQDGETLPKREVMSVLSTNPSVIAIPEDPLVVEPVADKPPDDELTPPPNYTA